MNFIRLLLVISFFFPMVAQADSGSDAIEAISKANEAYEGGDFYKAIREYRIAYSLTKDPRVLYRIGITYESLGNFQRAKEFLERYLKESTDDKYVGRVKKKVETLGKLQSTVQSTLVLTTSPTKAQVFLKSESELPFGTSPINVPLAPGSHTFLIVKEGYESSTLNVEIDASQTLKEKVKLQKIKETFVEKKKVKIEKKKQVEPEEDPLTVDSIYGRKIQPVRLGPSSGMNILLWSGIGVSVLSVLVGTLGVADSSSEIPSVELFLFGTGTFALSSYFLWVHDWDSDLAELEATLPPTKSFSVEINF